MRSQWLHEKQIRRVYLSQAAMSGRLTCTILWARLYSGSSSPVPISKDDVERVAHLARIGIDPTEIDTYTADLDRILDLVEQMNEISTQGIEPLAHPQDMQLRLRADTVTESDQRALFQSIAPQTDQGHYLVPKVID